MHICSSAYDTGDDKYDDIVCNQNNSGLKNRIYFDITHHIMLFPKSIYVNVTFGYDHIAWKKFLHCDNIPNTVTKCYGTHGRNENMIFFFLKS